jgi:hypothetical protein
VFAVTTEIEGEGRFRRHALYNGVDPVSCNSVIELWRESQEFRIWYTTALAAEPFSCFRWETSALTRATADRPFEYVVVNAPGIDMPADSDPFESYFASAKGSVVTFPNLGGDALLVVPTPQTDHSAYSHLATFLRGAPEAQIDAFWAAVGEAMAQRLGDRPVWLSTAGGGVAWLHVRLDNRPKYYAYQAFAHE